jgi:hypothetical protein
MPKSHRESAFVSEFRKSVLTLWPGSHWVTVPDFPSREVGGYGGREAARFTPPKPYDAYAVILGEFFAFEFKRPAPKTTRIGLDQVRPSQREGLEAVERAAGRAYLVALFGEREQRTCWCIPWRGWRELEGHPELRRNERSITLYDLGREGSAWQARRVRTIEDLPSGKGAVVWDLQRPLGMLSSRMAGLTGSEPDRVEIEVEELPIE